MSQHSEAFALMWYACECGHRERIWNSRDGVTPFCGISCPSCGGKDPLRHGKLQRRGLTHVHWQLDEPAPNHRLIDGQRFFRDGTRDEALRIVDRRISWSIKSGHDVPPHVADSLRENARSETGEWQKGWPFVDRHPKPRQPDADNLVHAIQEADRGISEIKRRFGAPGNWGYDTDLGQTLLAIYTVQAGLRAAIAEPPSTETRQG